MNGNAEYDIFRVYEGGRQGKRIASIEASTYKWGPHNAFLKFVAQQLPEAGEYMVVGIASSVTSIVFSIFTVKYPLYVIEGGTDCPDMHRLSDKPWNFDKGVEPAAAGS